MEKIALRQVGFAYHNLGQTTPVFQGLNLTVEAGEFLAVLGPSGCGKSTLLHILAGLEPVQDGQVLIGGAPTTGPGTDKGIVFQDYSLFPWMTAGRNVAFCARQANRSLSRREADTLAATYLAQVGLAGQENSYPSQLSGGMRQRVAIARALVMEPEILLFDEPFGALDPQTRIRLQCLLETLWEAGEPRRTVVFVTHDIDEALLLADRVVFLDRGTILEDFRVPMPHPRNRESLMTAQACICRKRCMRLFGQSGGEAE